ncbi:MAG TPA: hypothetical protein VNT22_07625 [Baekduia sp.]|nr:hypothetical protein [Baekduia sp.]
MPADVTTPAPLSPEALLEREADQRQRTGVLALAAAIFLVISSLLSALLRSGGPDVLLLDGLRDAAGEPFGDPRRAGLLNDQLDYMHSHLGLVAGGMVAQIIYLSCLAFVLIYLFDAAKGRRRETQPWLRSLALAGIAATAVALIIQLIAVHISIGDFLNASNQDSQAARDALKPPATQIAGLLGLFGGLALSISWVMIVLNAMRTGLLTRFIGTLGMFSGVLVFPLFSQYLSNLIIVVIFWLVAVGLTILQLVRGRQGIPPAWLTGKAEPWPTAAQVREQRQALAAKDKPAGDSPEEDAPSPATSARKRKRRS